MKFANTLITIFKHHHWANLEIFDICCKLTDDQLNASIPGVYGTIRETLNHIMRAERSYLSRITTGEPSNQSENTIDLPVEKMRNEVNTTGKGLIESAPNVKGEDLVELNWEGYPREVPKTIILNQAINHATEHRSQIMSILTQIGIEPPDVSSWSYFEGLLE